MKFNKVSRIGTMVLMHVASSALPFLATPYLVRTLGLEAFGSLGFHLAICQYLLLAVEIGFTLSAAKYIASKKDSDRRSSRALWDITLVKLSLAAAGVSIVSIWMLGTAYETGKSYIFWATSILLLGHALTPNWLYLGGDSMMRYSLLSLLARTCSTGMLIWFVNSPNDAVIAAASQSSHMLLTAILCWLDLASKRKILPPKVSWRRIKIHTLRSWPYFVASSATSLYTSSTPLLIGLIAGDAAVGIFTAADRIRLAAQSLITPLGHFFFPRVIDRMRESKIAGIQAARESLLAQGTINIGCAVMLAFFSSIIVVTMYGQETFVQQIHITLLLMSPLVAMVGINSALSTYTLIPLGLAKRLSHITMVAGIFHVAALTIALSTKLQHAATVTLLATEILMMCGMLLSLKILQVRSSDSGSNSTTLSALTVLLHTRDYARH